MTKEELREQLLNELKEAYILRLFSSKYNKKTLEEITKSVERDGLEYLQPYNLYWDFETDNWKKVEAPVYWDGDVTENFTQFIVFLNKNDNCNYAFIADHNSYESMEFDAFEKVTEQVITRKEWRLS